MNLNRKTICIYESKQGGVGGGYSGYPLIMVATNFLVFMVRPCF